MKTVNQSNMEEMLGQFFDKVSTQLTLVQEASPHIKQPKQLTDKERAVLIAKKMTSSKYCRSKPPSLDAMVAVIERHIERKQPIPCILGHGPLKNRNNCQYQHADWAELLSYLQLSRLANDVKALYEPGLDVSLYLDDARSHFANEVPWDVMDAYRHSVQAMIEQTSLKRLISNVVSFKNLYENHDHEHCLDEAKAWAQDWVKNPLNAETWVEMLQHAHRNLVFPEEIPFEAREEKAQDATFRYIWCHRAEQVCGIWSDPNKLYMRYSPHDGFYQIYTLRKGSVSQPWQGQGCLTLTEQGKIDPGILTVSKKHRLKVAQVVQTPLNLPLLQTVDLVQSVSVKPDHPVAQLI